MPARADRIRALVDRTGAVTNRDVVRLLGGSAATAHRRLRALVLAGTLELHGRGSRATYRFPHLRHRFRREGVEEDVVWQRLAREITAVRPLDDDEATSL